MQIFYINLDREVGRRAYMERQLESIGLAGERLQATIPDDIPAATRLQACDPKRPRHVTPAELACTMSHRAAWQSIVERNLPSALILEDDVHLSPRLGTLLQALEPHCTDLDIIRVESRVSSIRLGRATTCASGISLRPIHSVVWSAGGYIVTRSGAERLLGSLMRYDIPVDQLLFDYHIANSRRLRTRQALPAGIANGAAGGIALHEQFPSTLEQSRQDRAALDRPVSAALTNARIRWGSGWLKVRDGLRAWVDRHFRGIEVMDVPLL